MMSYPTDPPTAPPETLGHLSELARRDALAQQETLSLGAPGAVPLAGVLRDSATYEAGSLSPELIDAELEALGAALGRWREERGAGLRAVSERARALLPEGLRGVTRTTLQRWIHDPKRELRRAGFASVRATVAALGYTMYDVADVMALARGRALRERYGAGALEASLGSLEEREVLTQAQQRWDLERELLAHFRTLDSNEQRVLVAQARGLTLTRQLGEERGRRGRRRSQPMLPVTAAAPDTALQSVLGALSHFEERALRERPEPSALPETPSGGHRRAGSARHAKRA